MIKFLFTTDWHLVSKNPRYRKDNIVLTQFWKIRHIFEIYKKKECSFIIHGGDLFDTYQPSFLVLNHLAKGIRTFNKRDAGEVYIVPGSHDMIGYNISSIKQTALGSLVNSGLLHILNEIEINGVNFVGVPASLNLTVDNLKFDNKVVICHGEISDISLPFEHILIDSITENSKDCLFLTGHIHKRIFKYDSNGNVFVNPGPVVRTSIDEKDIKPSVAVISINDKGKVDVEFVELICSDDVFDIESYEFNKQNDIKFNNFLTQLKNFDVDLTSSLENLIKEYGTKLNISQEVIDECIRRISSE